MLLRRIKHHVVNENWFAVFVDFVIVVVGVYVGIEVSNWNDERREDERAVEYLERLRGDLEHDKATANYRQEFWSDVVLYGRGAIIHGESGLLFRESVGQTVLAYFQASQVDPYAAVSTTYDELKAAGELHLIRDAALRQRLGDYYVSSTSLQAEHLFQYLPRYREYIRGLVPHAIQQHIWANCYVTIDRRQQLIDCEMPIDEDQGRELLESLRSDPEVLNSLRFWITNLSVASSVIDDNMGEIDELLESVRAELTTN